MKSGSQRVLVIGESLVDLVDVPGHPGRASTVPGGGPLNAAIALARLGAPVDLCTAFADDCEGDLIAQHLSASGVRIDGDPRLLRRTSTARTAALRGTAYDFAIDSRLPEPRCATPPLHVHVGSIGAVLPPGADTVLAAVERLHPQATVSYDVNARPAATGRSAELLWQVEALVCLADLVQVSDDDLAFLFPGELTEAAAECLLEQGPAAVVVTYGAEGAACHTPDGVIHLPGPRVVVADTIGAGDTFCAATIDGLRLLGVLGGDHRSDLHGLALDDWRQVLARATRAAGITVSRHGADAPTADELGEVRRALAGCS